MADVVVGDAVVAEAVVVVVVVVGALHCCANPWTIVSSNSGIGPRTKLNAANAELWSTNSYAVRVG